MAHRFKLMKAFDLYSLSDEAREELESISHFPILVTLTKDPSTDTLSKELHEGGALPGETVILKLG